MHIKTTESKTPYGRQIQHDDSRRNAPPDGVPYHDHGGFCATASTTWAGVDHCLLSDRSYVVRTTHNNILRGMRFDAPTLRFTMGRSARSLTLDAVDAVQDGGQFVPIGAWYVEPVE